MFLRYRRLESNPLYQSLSSRRQRVELKDFHAEVRARRDVDLALSSSVVLLDLHAQGLDQIITAMLNALISAQPSSGLNVSTARNAIFTSGKHSLNTAVSNTPFPNYVLNTAIPYTPFPNYVRNTVISYTPFPNYVRNTAIPYTPFPNYGLNTTIPYTPFPNYGLNTAIPYTPFPNYGLNTAIPSHTLHTISKLCTENSHTLHTVSKLCTRELTGPRCPTLISI